MTETVGLVHYHHHHTIDNSLGLLHVFQFWLAPTPPASSVVALKSRWFDTLVTAYRGCSNQLINKHARVCVCVCVKLEVRFILVKVNSGIPAHCQKLSVLPYSVGYQHRKFHQNPYTDF